MRPVEGNLCKSCDLRDHIVVTEPGSEISDKAAEDMKKMYLSSVF